MIFFISLIGSCFVVVFVDFVDVFGYWYFEEVFCCFWYFIGIILCIYLLVLFNILFIGNNVLSRNDMWRDGILE